MYLFSNTDCTASILLNLNAAVAAFWTRFADKVAFSNKLFSKAVLCESVCSSWLHVVTFFTEMC